MMDFPPKPHLDEQEERVRRLRLERYAIKLACAYVAGSAMREAIPENSNNIANWAHGLAERIMERCE